MIQDVGSIGCGRGCGKWAVGSLGWLLSDAV